MGRNLTLTSTQDKASITTARTDAEAGISEPLSQLYAQQAKLATHEGTTNLVVLGKHIPGSPQSYDEVAQRLDATYFSMDNWDGMSAEIGFSRMWNINKTFLDQQINEGKTFAFTVNPESTEVRGSATEREWIYLKSKGYRINKHSDGMYYVYK